MLLGTSTCLGEPWHMRLLAPARLQMTGHCLVLLCQPCPKYTLCCPLPVLLTLAADLSGWLTLSACLAHVAPMSLPNLWRSAAPCNP